MDLSEEKSIIKEAKKNPEAFGLLYDKYYKQIFGYILKRTADIDLAQDLTSETFFKSLKSLDRFRWRNIPFSAWLYRIANNEIINYFRKKKTIPLEKIPEPIANSDPSGEIIQAEKELERHQDFLTLQKKILKLSFKYQEVITLRFFEKKEIKEINEILGKKEGTIKSLLHRGLEQLKNFMEE